MSPREIPDDDPVTLKEACEIVFRNTITPATLKAAARAGRLPVSLIGRCYFTTIRDAKALHHQCLVEQKAPVSILIRRAESGSSETARVSSALDALRASTDALKGSSRNTSLASTNRQRARSR
jgi:hypothetical protein